MSRATQLHHEAMEFCDQAFAAKRAANEEQAQVLFRQALECEREAAEFFRDKLDVEPTRSVLYRSAATLALDCGDYHAVDSLVAIALKGKPHAEIVLELKELRHQARVQRLKETFLRPFAHPIKDFQYLIDWMGGQLHNLKDIRPPRAWASTVFAYVRNSPRPLATGLLVLLFVATPLMWFWSPWNAEPMIQFVEMADLSTNPPPFPANPGGTPKVTRQTEINTLASLFIVSKTRSFGP